MIKLIVCDLDGTLINDADIVEAKTLQDMKDTQSDGIQWMLATGRDYTMVIDLINRYTFIDDMILNNGVQIRNREGSFHFIYPMNFDVFSKIFHILKEYDYVTIFHTDNGKYSYLDADTFWKRHMNLLIEGHKGEPLPKKTFTTRELYLADFHYVSSPEELNAKPLKIDARHENPAQAKGIMDLLKAIDDLHISSSYEENIEITSAHHSKGSMLEKYLEMKGIQKDEVATFGDGLNDVSLLEKFPYSFAPSQSRDEVKNAAAYVIDATSDTGFVHEGIEILRKKGLL